MKWDYWICLYIEMFCVARGLRNSSIAAYKATLEQYHGYVERELKGIDPDQISASNILEYIKYLREDRNNQAAAVNRQVTILKNFYRAMVSMNHLEPRKNPLSHFPKMKDKSRKLPVVLSAQEVERLLDAPGSDTVIGVRDHAILTLLYSTGIRASECAGLNEEDVDLEERTIRVTGKGGHQRVIPLNDTVIISLKNYRQVRGLLMPESAFFRSRNHSGMSRNTIYERVRKYAREARIPKRVSPHKLRHTFATHLVQEGVSLVTIRDLLGHKMITSTQIYLHVTAQELRQAAIDHPIKRLAPTVEKILPDVKMAFQGGGFRRGYG
ncbi:MAG: tyrosine-type recombinase/integrase [Phycisphaerae bacterium]|nr:tyrosine-type recombinase/integrase [Phycisphaerae bacterium]